MFLKLFPKLWRELNEFFSSTSIHGFPYIHHDQSRPTRTVWTLFVAVALATATVFLIQTVEDWETKHITTTIETRNVEEFPFPAVTFHPGEFSSERSFLRTFLNQFQLIRSNMSSPIYDNKIFFEQFKTYAKNFKGNRNLFDWVKDYLLIQDNSTFINEKKGIVRSEVCSLTSLISTGKMDRKELTKEVIYTLSLNMFKYFGFRNTIGFLTKTMAAKIEGMVEQLNITRPEIEDHCQRAENDAIKKEFEAILLSYVYVFMDETSSEVGYGDLSAEEYFNTEKLNGNLTKIFNSVAGSSLPSRIPVQDISKFFKKNRNPV